MTHFLSRSLRRYVLLLLVTAIAALLRFYRLGDWSFWSDEVFTIGFHEDGFNFSPWRQSLATTLIHFTINTWGTHEWSARFAPALIGIGTVPLLYFPLRKLFGTTVALLAILLLALSPWHIYWSQNARFYSLLFLFYSLALLTAFIGFEEDRPWYLLISLILIGLATRERLLALFFLPVIVSYLFLLRILPFAQPAGLHIRNLVLFFTPQAILAAFFAGPYLRNLAGWMEGFGRVNNNPLWLAAGVIYYVGLPTACVATIGAIYLFRQRERAALFFTLNALIPLLTLMAIAPFHYTANRYAFITLTSWLLLASLTAREVLHTSLAQARPLVAGLLLILVIAPLSEDVLYFRYQHGNRDNWRAAFAFIQQNQQPGDRIVTAQPDIGDYYMGTETLDLEELDTVTLAAQEERLWFVEDLTVAELYPAALNWIKQNTYQVADYDVHVYARNFKMRVYLYDPGGQVARP